MQSQKDAGTVHEEIRSFLSTTDRKIEDERTENNLWILFIKQDGFKVKIEHPTNKKYIHAIFSYELEENKRATLITELLINNTYVEFNYGLMNAINSPNVDYSFRRAAASKGDIAYIGFDIKAKVFPYENSYSIAHLEGAIQNVINAGRLGIYYFALKLKSSKDLMKQIEELNSSPEGLYI